MQPPKNDDQEAFLKALEAHVKQIGAYGPDPKQSASGKKIKSLSDERLANVQSLIPRAIELFEQSIDSVKPRKSPGRGKSSSKG